MPIRFQVDPDFYDHPKVLGMSDAATALWVRAGSYSAAKLTDGFIAEHVLAMLSTTPVEASDELRRRGLWHKVRGGYRFHEWEHRNLTRTRVEGDRKADRERKKRQRTAVEGSPRHARDEGVPDNHSAGNNGTQQVNQQNVRPESNRSPDGIQPESEWIPPVSVSVSVSESVSGSGRGSPGRVATGSAAPPPRCQRHLEDLDPPPCGACGDARRRRDEWDRAEVVRRADMARTAPRCRTHVGELAANCRLCRADAIAAPTGSYPVIAPRQR